MHHIKKAAVISECLCDVTWKNRYMVCMKTESKTRSYKTCLRLVMNYGIEAKANINRTKGKMQPSDMKTLWAISGNRVINMRSLRRSNMAKTEKKT